MKLIKLWGWKEIKRLSYTFTLFPISAWILIYHWDKGHVTKESNVCPFFSYIFTDGLLNIQKFNILTLLTISVFMLIWILCANYKVPTIEKMILRAIYEFFTQQMNNVVRILAGALLGLWLVANQTDIVDPNKIEPLWTVPCLMFFSFVYSYYSRRIFNHVIIKGT